LPFVDDPIKEMELIKKEREENQSSYGFEVTQNNE
jgi:hypothetical protein